MRIGVCSVGNEIVAGDQVDTNAAWVARRLTELGATPVLHVAAPDDHDGLVAALRWLLDGCDGVVVGGGLGPTPDDLTRHALASLAGAELTHRPDLEDAIRARFAAAGSRMSDNNRVQALLPAGAVAWPPAGTAPGFVMEVDARPVWVLPGVPWELRQLFDAHVAGDVRRRCGTRVTVTRVVHVTGRGESSVATRLAGIESQARDAGIGVAYLATGTEIQVKLSVVADDVAQGQADTGAWVAQIEEALGESVAGVDATTPEQRIVGLLTDSGTTVAVAESATAGQVCARLAEVEGASRALRGGVVVYATATKAGIGGIDPRLLDAHPPVSAEVTAALAESVRRRLGSDYGVATTGVAGPDEQDGVAVGQVYWAVADGGSTRVDGRMLPGDRAAVRARLTAAALDALRRRLLHDRR